MKNIIKEGKAKCMRRILIRMIILEAKMDTPN